MTLPPIPFAEIAALAARNGRTICERWLPGGRAEGHEWVALNPTRVDNSLGSFRINLRTGKWADFATGDKGGDFVSLYKFLSGCSVVEAARTVAGMVGHPFGDTHDRLAANRDA